MNNLKAVTLAFVPAVAWFAAATSTGAPIMIAAPGSLLLVALAGGIKALVTPSSIQPTQSFYEM